MLFFHMHGLSGSGIAPHPRVPLLDRKCTKASQFNPVTARHRAGHFVEYRVYDPLHVPLVQMWVLVSDLLDKL